MTLSMKRLLYIACFLLSRLHSSDSLGRILEGVKAKSGQFPYYVTVFHEARPRKYCGGSLVSEYHVLTAAHCVEEASPVELRISHGDAINCEHRSVKRVKRVYVHTEYSRDTFQNDIAIVELAKPYVVNATSQWQLVLLSNESTPVEHDDYVLVMGIGGTLNSDFPPCTLLSVTVPIIGHDECSRKWWEAEEKSIDNHTQLCAGALNRGTSKGDSGGPMVVTSAGDNRPVQIALTSFGRNEPPSDLPLQHLYPGVYTRIAPFCPWLEEVSKGEVSCGQLEDVVEKKGFLARWIDSLWTFAHRIARWLPVQWSNSVSLRSNLVSLPGTYSSAHSLHLLIPPSFSFRRALAHLKHHHRIMRHKNRILCGLLTVYLRHLRLFNANN